MRKFDHIFTFDAVLSSKDSKDPETLDTIKGVTQTVKCYKSGKTLYIRDGLGFKSVDAMFYLFKADVNIKLGDRLDGQLVQVINIHNRAGNRRRLGDTKIIEVYTYA